MLAMRSSTKAENSLAGSSQAKAQPVATPSKLSSRPKKAFQSTSPWSLSRCWWMGAGVPAVAPDRIPFKTDAAIYGVHELPMTR